MKHALRPNQLAAFSAARSLMTGSTHAIATAFILVITGCSGGTSANDPRLSGSARSPSQAVPPAAAPAEMASCHLEMSCPAFDEWRDLAASIVDIRTSDDLGRHGCTGVLLNNAAGDGTPYVLTARHCRNGRDNNIGEQLSWWKFYFGRISDRCGAPVTGRAPECRVENNCLWGAEVAVTGTGGNDRYSLSRDFMLVRLSSRIPQSFGARFAGWTVDGSTPQNGTVLGHPDGRPMTIALDHDPLETTTDCDIRGTMWRLMIDEGELIVGHSGSPVFDEQGRVRGSLLTGANCAHNRRSCASSLAFNWTYGAPGARLIDHLAGGDTQIRSLPGR